MTRPPQYIIAPDIYTYNVRDMYYALWTLGQLLAGRILFSEQQKHLVNPVTSPPSTDDPEA